MKQLLSFFYNFELIFRLNIAKSLCPILLIILVGSQALAKYNACFATINSSEEKFLFQKYLNADHFNFIELVPGSRPGPGDSSKSWFSQACERKVHCDILVISGHFAGSFFGESGYELGLNDLETYSCQKQSCSGILNNPTEVFLFGCNTLANKDADRRSPQVYARHLIDDEGFGIAEAERVAESRYGVFGQSNEERIQRIFRGVPAIYGFYSSAPLGAVIQHSLRQYLASIPDYGSHLEEVKNRSLINRLPELNPNFSEFLKRFPIRACPGAQDQINEDPIQRFICFLSDESVDVATRIRAIEESIFTDHFHYFVPAMSRFFDKHLPQNLIGKNRAQFDKLAMNNQAHQIMTDLFEKIQFKVLKHELSQLFYKLTWITQEQFLERTKNLFTHLVSGPRFRMAERNALCDLVNDNLFIDIRLSEIPNRLWQSIEFVESLKCLQPKDPQIANKLLDLAKSKDLDPYLRARAIWTLGEISFFLKTSSPIIGLLVMDSDYVVANAALWYFSANQTNDKNTINNMIHRMLENNNNYSATANLMLMSSLPLELESQHLLASGLASKDANVRGMSLRIFEHLAFIKKVNPNFRSRISELVQSDTSHQNRELARRIIEKL